MVTEDVAESVTSPLTAATTTIR